MNITVLCNRDLASNYALNLLLPRLAPSHRVHVFCSGRVGGQRAGSGGLAKLAFAEQSLFNDILFPALDERGRYGELRGFSALCYGMQTPLAELYRVNSDDSLARLAATEPDLVISIRYGGILREKAIATPLHGVINLHSGILPAYRGVMASFRAMLHGDSHLGATLHTITDPGIDTGEVVDVVQVRADYQRSYLWNVLQLYPPGVELLLAAVDTVAKGQPLQTRPQAADGAYYSFPSESELTDFGSRGLTLWEGRDVWEFARRYLPASRRSHAPAEGR